MNVKDIPFIIPNFNQVTYLRNLINQIWWYYPENPIVVVDNGSTYEPLLHYYNRLESPQSPTISVVRYPENDFVKNITQFIKDTFQLCDYLVLTDPDLSILPTTPPNFLEIFKAAIDNHGFHHAGFGLKTDDIPAWNPKAGWIQGDEKALLSTPVTIEHEGQEYHGWKAPIDTCFALYKRDNGGWQAPMPAENWSNSLRLFEAYHLPWYLHKDYLNPEMQNYFATCKKRVLGAVTAGSNHYNPFNGMD